MNKFFVRLSSQEKMLFAKRLSALVKGGVPILTGLNMLRKQTKSRSQKMILDQVIIDVEQGQYLATSLAKFRRVFGEFAINIIEIGEISGTLPENLEYLAQELKKSYQLKRKIFSAMVYPIFIVVATFAITALLTVFVFPRILPIFQSVNFDLPLSTKILIFISNFLLHWGFAVVAGLFVAVVLFILLLRNRRIHLWFDHVLLSLPIFGSLMQNYNVTNICRTLGVLLRSDVKIVRAAQITANTTTNLAYRNQLKTMAEHILKGEKASVHLEKHPRLFPITVSQLVQVGENTGNLSDTLLYLAEMYESEVEEQTKNLSTVLEPALMVFMGLLVGFVAVSIITPIYEITQHLSPRG